MALPRSRVNARAAGRADPARQHAARPRPARARRRAGPARPRADSAPCSSPNSQPAVVSQSVGTSRSAPMPDARAISASATYEAAVGEIVAGRAPSRARSRRARTRRCAARAPDRPAAARPPRGHRSRADRASCRASPGSRRPGPAPDPQPRSGKIADHASRSSITPRPPIVGVGRIALAVGLVVERDVARDDREVERPAGLAPCPRCSRRTGP